MRPPVVVVTGPIASGKTTVAEVLAGRGGTLLDCDSLAHRALADGNLKKRLVGEFGGGVLTPAGNVSRARLGRIVFSGDEKLAVLNRVIRPIVKKIISDEIRAQRGNARYIVLDAVLYFQYKFRFKVDLVVRTAASEGTRVRRMMKRDELSRAEALMRIERQNELEDDWRRADVTVGTDGPESAVIRVAAKIRDDFLNDHGISWRERDGRKDDTQRG